MTGFLNPENVLIDFSGSEDEEEEEEEKQEGKNLEETLDEEERARQRKAYAISALLGGRPLNPTWANLALGPVGLKSCPSSPQIWSKHLASKASIGSGLSRSSSKENLGLSMTRVVDVGNCSPYLR